MKKPEPINPTDDEARALAKNIMDVARHGALAVTRKDGVPYVARVAVLADQGNLLTLISTLSAHTTALRSTPSCAILIGEPGPKGDPLTHPRMTLTCTAEVVEKANYKSRWLASIPKAQLYYDFTDFLMFRLVPSEIRLNGGFGKAFQLAPSDLT